MSNKIYGYTVVSYPESMPDDWKIKLGSLPFGYCYSLHDKDRDEEGNQKKPHEHFYFQGSPTKKQKQYIHEALGVEYGEPVRSAGGMYDYLTHENNPNKYHYSKDNIQHSEKWNQELFESSYTPVPTEAEMIDFIEEYDIEEFSDLLKLLRTLGRTDLLKTATRYWVQSYITSRREGAKRDDAKVRSVRKQA